MKIMSLLDKKQESSTPKAKMDDNGPFKSYKRGK